MSNGKDFKVFISSDGTVSGTKTEIEYQGDLTITTGRTNESTNFKNGTITAQGNAGFSATMQVAATAPLGTGAALLRTASNNGGSTYMWFESTVVGSINYAGPVKASVTQDASGVNGVRTWDVQINENGAIVETVQA